jgi:hypothetical protein
MSNNNFLYLKILVLFFKLFLETDCQIEKISKNYSFMFSLLDVKFVLYKIIQSKIIY